MHRGQLQVLPATVSSLVIEQFPQWRHLPVRPVSGAGTVNAIFRLGDALVLRFPLESAGDPATVRRGLQLEAAAAEELNHRTPFATPQPVAIGDPGAGYPLPWSVFTWLPGTPATSDNLCQSDSFAEDLVVLIGALRAIGTRGRTFGGNGRGGDLLDHDEWVQECLRNSSGLLDVKALQGIWTEMRDLPRGDAADVMSHRDLIPPNLLSHDGRLGGVLDVGGFGAADPALDLVSAWHLLDAQRRRLFRDQLDCGDAEWSRGRAWAFEQAIGAVWYYAESNPAMSVNCRRTLGRIVADAGVCAERKWST